MSYRRCKFCAGPLSPGRSIICDDCNLEFKVETAVAAIKNMTAYLEQMREYIKPEAATSLRYSHETIGEVMTYLKQKQERVT